MRWSFLDTTLESLENKGKFHSFSMSWKEAWKKKIVQDAWNIEVSQWVGTGKQSLLKGEIVENWNTEMAWERRNKRSLEWKRHIEGKSLASSSVYYPSSTSVSHGQCFSVFLQERLWGEWDVAEITVLLEWGSVEPACEGFEEYPGDSCCACWKLSWHLFLAGEDQREAEGQQTLKRCLTAFPGQLIHLESLLVGSSQQYGVEKRRHQKSGEDKKPTLYY